MCSRVTCKFSSVLMARSQPWAVMKQEALSCQSVGDTGLKPGLKIWMHQCCCANSRACMQMYLAALWVFNFGAVMSWLPWMYRWHLQPETDRERVS